MSKHCAPHIRGAWAAGDAYVCSTSLPARQVTRATGFALALLGAVILTLCLATPALAAWTWYPTTPGDGDIVATTQPIIVSYMSDSAYPIDPTKGTLTINGAAATPILSTYDAVLNYGTIMFDPAAAGASPSALPYGVNTITASATNTNLETSTYSWSFTVDAPPTIVSVSPAAGAFVTSSQAPTISVTLSDPDDTVFFSANGYVMKVDGSVVSPTWNGATQTYSYKRTFPPNPPWPNGTTHSVQFNAQDAAGNVVSRSWSFTVDTSADIVKPTLTEPNPIPGSTTNPRPSFSITVGDNRPGSVNVGFSVDGVPAYSTSVSLPAQNATQVVVWQPSGNLSAGPHTVSANATDAAGNAAIAQTWSFAVADSMAANHSTSTSFTNCRQCHSNVLTTEHENRGLDCDTCHGVTASQTVQNAITADNTACDACHTYSVAHATVHTNGLPTVTCSGCHTSNLSEEHANNCALCHESVDPAVVAAIAAGSATCVDCHVNIHPDYVVWDSTLPDNEGGPHGNYIATSTKCRICHSVHRAAGSGAKLLPTSDVTCGGCHAGATSISAKSITWSTGTMDVNWQPVSSLPGGVGGPAWMAATGADRYASITNKPVNGGPHNDSAANLIEDGLWDGIGAAPPPGYTDGTRYGCSTRRCHAENPHGAGGSKYKILAAKVLFNEAASALGTRYGGLDVPLDDLGASDAAVERFVSANSSVVATTAGGDILVNGTAPDAGETHALVAGLTCGRPSANGLDECHAEASYAIVDKRIKEQRNHATGITAGSAYRTDNTGEEALGYGGNDNRDWKTGHVAGTFSAVPGSASYAPIAGCTSCHDQTDSANLVDGRFTFPHGQTAAGASNITSDGVLPYAGRARLWMGYSAGVGAPLFPVSGTSQKAYDGNCLKCHRNGLGNGIGLDH